MSHPCGGCVHINILHSEENGYCIEPDCNCKYTPPTVSYLINLDGVFYCSDCERPIETGQPYFERFDCYVGEKPDSMGEFDRIVEQICVYCVGV